MAEEYIYLQSTKSVVDLIAALRKSMPSGGVVTPDYIRMACDVAEGTARNVVNDLKKFAFIAADGTLTDRGRLLRSPDRVTEIGHDILGEFYPDLMQLLELHPDNWATKLDSFLSEKTTLGESGRGKVRATVGFFWTMSQGQWPNGDDKRSAPSAKTGDKPQAKPQTRGMQKPGTPAATPNQEGVWTSTAPSARQQSDLSTAELLSSVLRITIDATWDAERINLVFDRLERLVNPRD